MNKADSERIAAVLEKKGYKKAKTIKTTDLIIVNMCSVRQSAVDRIYGLIKKFKKFKASNSKIKTILTGCVLKKDVKNLSKGFDKISKFNDLFNFKPERQEKTPAYIPISNGCNNACAYCVVPHVRGKLICRDHKDILKEVKETASNGFKEIWLLGQNVNDYQSPSSPKINFANLLKLTDQVHGIFLIRFMSPHPKYFSDELIKTMADSKKNR